MKNTSILTFILIILFTGCSKQNETIIKVEDGRFDGNLGRHGYYLINDNYRDVIKTIIFKNGNYKFEFEYRTKSNNGFENFEIYQRLAVSLNKIYEKNSFQLFQPYQSEQQTNYDEIALYTSETFGNKIDTRFYTTVKNKNSISIVIDSLVYKELKVPSLVGKIKGYLYNKENSIDSIFVDATFRTQARDK